jgi:hypothetical protein
MPVKKEPSRYGLRGIMTTNEPDWLRLVLWLSLLLFYLALALILRKYALPALVVPLLPHLSWLKDLLKSSSRSP